MSESAQALAARSERLASLRDELPGLRAGAGLMGTTTLDPVPWIAARGEPLWLDDGSILAIGSNHALLVDPETGERVFVSR